MNFFLKFKNILAQLLLIVFVISAVAVPVGTAFAERNPADYAAANADTQGGFEAAMAALDNDSPPDTGCTSGKNKIAGCSALLSYYLFIFTYWIAGWLSLFFNFSLNYFVMGMGALFAEMDGIMVAWKTVRDVANVFLVFLTVYIGIATILGISGYGAKQLLWKVVLAALLVNFSVTFTKVVIDISNATAMQIYTMFEQEIYSGPGAPPAPNCTKRSTGDENPCITQAIAGAFWSQLKITTLFDAKKLSEGLNSSNVNKPNAGEVYKKMIVIFLMGSAMFIVLAFVFGGAGILLLARFVILVFLLILSPIALVLWITGVSSQGRAWWGKLIGQSFFPAAILLCWWLAYVILRTFSDQERIPGSLTEGVLTTSSGVSIVSMFVIVISFLIAGLILASKMGAYGAKAVLNTGERWSRNTAGFFGATVIGGTAAYAARKQRESIAKTQRKDENGNYIDTSLRGRWHQTTLGKKAARGFNSVLAAPSKSKFGGAKSFTEQRESANKAAKEQKTEHDKFNRASAITDAISGSNPATTARVLRDTSVAELTENADTLRDNPNSIAHVSRANYKKLRENKDGTFTESELRNFDSARSTHYSRLSSTDALQEIQTSSAADLAGHEANFLARDDVVRNIDTQTLSGMVRNGLSQDKRDAMRQSIEAQYNAMTDPTLPPTTLTQREQDNIDRLYTWFNDPNRMNV